MNNEISDFFTSLEDDSAMQSSNPHRQIARQVETFPCLSCHGTGKFRGVRVHQQQSECFACGGKGHHNKPHHQALNDKRAAKAKREDGVRNAQQSREERFEAQNPGLLVWMRAQTWSGFIGEMLQAIASPRGISERQLAAVLSTKAKQEARRVEKQIEAKKAEVTVDLAAIEAIFDNAGKSGLKKPAYRAEGVVISRAPTNGRNAGALYVKSVNDEYLGKIVNNVFQPTYEARQQHTADKLIEIAKNPLEAAVRYGRLTGSCSCCGRALTDKNSVAAGIGPICATKWGL